MVHYRNLGMVVTGFTVFQFKQSPWLKPYIDFNTKQRTLASSKFEKDFFKLMNNAVYGKTQENSRKRINVELIIDETILKKRVASWPSINIRPHIMHFRRLAFSYTEVIYR